MLIRLTIATPDAGLRNQLREILARPDVLVHLPRARKETWERIIRQPCDVLIVSQSLPVNDLPAVLSAIQRGPDAPAIVLLADAPPSTEAAARLAAGCDAVLAPSQALDQLRAVVEDVLEKRRRLSQRRLFARQPLGEPRLADFVSQSPRMAEFMQVVPRVVHSDSSLLIEGETGVGKERLACAIHAEGPRARKRFVALNCGALPEHLLESELFGHVRGAFTGATTSRRGWFEMAHQGTLFLDEVSEIPLHLQVKLLRVLQEQEIQPVGSEETLQVDVRVIAASNQSLKAAADANRFRHDLFYRLSVVTVTVPPLRARREDIPVLVERHISHLAQQLARPVVGIYPQALSALCRYAWPGNVRELNNVLERAILLCDDSLISLEDLPEVFSRIGTDPASTAQVGPARPASTTPSPADGRVPLAAAARVSLPGEWLHRPFKALRSSLFADLERQYFEGLLLATRGRIGDAARRAGLSPRSLYEKMQQFGLHKESFRRLSAHALGERRIQDRRGADRRRSPAG